jgi:dTDP-4-dehydrorhamnose 3,5-epimerase
MKVIKTDLKEVLIVEYEEMDDSRGTKYSTFSQREFAKFGIDFKYVEENIYCPLKTGTIYGIHFQNNPMPQAKLLYCIEGSGLDYAVDLRKESSTYLKWVSVKLSSENRRQIFIPKGFGHAFLSLEDKTKVVMRIDNYFDSKYSRQIAWNDPMIGIKYPITNPILAQHDIVAPKLADSDINL